MSCVERARTKSDEEQNENGKCRVVELAGVIFSESDRTDREPKSKQET